MRWIVRIAAALAALGLVLAVGLAVAMRLVSSDPATWHVDPVEAMAPDTPNFALVRPQDSPLYPVAPAVLAAEIDRLALATPRTRRLAGDPDALRVTYVTRSAVFGFPDYISVRVVEAEGGARLAAFARARFGQSDLGVNRARLDAWLAALAPLEG